ncbi:MAG: sigma 54-interacting transcriptional regulator [Spirochaeta sp.]
MQYQHTTQQQNDILAYVHACFIPIMVIGSPLAPAEAAHSCIQAGASDYITPPLVPHQIIKRVEYLSARYWAARQQSGGGLRISEKRPSPAPHTMEKVAAQIERYADRDEPVVITGESGAGKEIIARKLHKRSVRSHGPFIPINCGAISESLFESEMFGVVRGAFTDSQPRPGAFLSAHTGTLFLDEIAEMPLSGQAALLRVLEQKQLRAVGSDKLLFVDARIIAATNRKLYDMVQSGGFREDLFYRLMVFHIHIPPLRERRHEIPRLIEELLAEDFKGTEVKFSQEVLEQFQRYSWPGNIRELRNIVQRVVVDSGVEEILPQHLGLLDTDKALCY